MFDMLSASRPDSLVPSENLILSSSQAALFAGKIVIFLGATDLMRAFNESVGRKDIDTRCQTADPRIAPQTVYPVKKIAEANRAAAGLVANGFAAPTIASAPAWISVLTAGMGAATLYGRVRQGMNIRMKLNPPKGTDTDKIQMYTDDDHGNGLWAHLVRLTENPVSVPGMSYGTGSQARTAVLLDWLEENCEGILPDAFVYDPICYDTITPWSNLDCGKVPFITAPYIEGKGISVQGTVDALVQAFEKQKSEN